MLYNFNECLEKYGSQYWLDKAVNAGEILRIEKGIYSDTPNPSDVSVVLKRYPDAVLSLRTAMYYHGLINDAPEKFDLATDRNAAKIRDDRVHQLFYPCGALKQGEIFMPYGDDILDIYNIERLCIEFVRFKTKLPVWQYKEAIYIFRRLAADIDRSKIEEYVEMMPKAAHILKVIDQEIF